MSLDIKSALGQLDTSKDEQWTSDGLPRLDALKALTGDASLTREKVEAEAPGFTRTGTAPAAPVAPAAGAQPWAPSVAQGAATTAAAPAAATTVAPVAPKAPAAAPIPVVLTADQKQAELDAAQDAYDAAEGNLSEIDKYLNEGKAARVKAEAARDAALKKLEALLPKETQTDAVMGYLESQRKLREQRGAQLTAVAQFQKEHGIKLADIIPKRAPLDVAMARRNTRGTGRTYGPKKP